MTETDGNIIVHENAQMKICKLCKVEKDGQKDFYKTGKYTRTECKKCTIGNSKKYQKENKENRKKYPTDDDRREYMRKYYLQHKDIFAGYRKTFLERHPGYYRAYYKNKKTASK